MKETDRYRSLDIPEHVEGMRLDRFLALRFSDYSRSKLVKSIEEKMVRRSDGSILRASCRVKKGETLHLFIPGIAPSTEKPSFPNILFEDHDVAVVEKPSGLLTHPAGNDFTWSLIGLARERWSYADLIHRIDRETSGIVLIAKNERTNRLLKTDFLAGRVEKIYDAFCVGNIIWDSKIFNQPIGPAEGPIRIQMAINPNGLSAQTDVEVVDRKTTEQIALTWVRCRLHTGRTHQIRVHLAAAGYRLLGERLYGVSPDVFLEAWENGVSIETFRQAGAPRHALHASSITFFDSEGKTVQVQSSIPEDMQRWWSTPEVLPLDGSF